MIKTPTMHTLPIGTLVGLFNGLYTATLKINSIYPYEDEYHAIRDVTILEEPDLIKVVTKGEGLLVFALLL